MKPSARPKPIVFACVLLVLGLGALVFRRGGPEKRVVVHQGRQTGSYVGPMDKPPSVDRPTRPDQSSTDDTNKLEGAARPKVAKPIPRPPKPATPDQPKKREWTPGS